MPPMNHRPSRSQNRAAAEHNFRVLASAAKAISVDHAQSARDCFVAQPVLGRRRAPTRGLLAMTDKMDFAIIEAGPAGMAAAALASEIRLGTAMLDEQARPVG